MSSPRVGARLRRRVDALTTPAGLFAVAALLAAVVPVTAPIRDPDFWWHLRTGQLIADHHGLLDSDPFTYTTAGHPWVMHEWLTEVSFAALHRLGGLGLIVAVLTAVTALGIALVALRARLPVPPWESVGDDGGEAPAPASASATVGDPWRRVGLLPLGAGMVLAAVAGYPIWGPRAQMITFAFTCLTLWLMESHLRRGGRAVWALVPAFLIWSNFHSGFIIGAGFLCAVLVAEVGAHLLHLGGRAPGGRVRNLATVVGACLAVVVINPNGPHIYLYPFETQGSAAQQTLIEEWHSPNFHDPVVLAFELMLLSLAVMLVANHRVRPRDAVLALAATAMALQSVRHIALFIAAATPLWIEQADLLLLRWRAWRRAGRPGSRRRPAPPPPLPFRLAALALVVFAPLAVEAPKLASAVTTGEDSPFYARDFPVCATRWLASAPAGLRVFNQYGEGGYLALHLADRGDRVFIFGDAALMGDDLLRRYGAVESVSPGWEAIVRESGTDIVLFDRETPLTDVLSHDPRWTEVYADARTSAFVPETAAGRALRSRLPAPTVAPADAACPAPVARR